MTPFYRRAYKIFHGIVMWFFNIHVTGMENEPEAGGCLVCANHISDADVVVLAAAMKRQVRFLAKAELFKFPPLAKFLGALGAFPIKRGTGDVGAIKTTLKLLDEGELVGFYPQGTRHGGVDPRGTEIRHGVAMVEHRSGAPVLPVCIQTKKYRILPFRRIDVRVGKLIMPEELAITSPSASEYKRASEYIFTKITDMIDDGKMLTDGAADNKAKADKTE